MRRLLVLTLLLLVVFTAAAQDEIELHFEIQDVQISPDGRHAVFSVATFDQLREDWPSYEESFLINLESGTVTPLALQPNGSPYCLTQPNDLKTCRIIGRPVFLADSARVVWGAMQHEEFEGNSVFRAPISWYSIKSQEVISDSETLLIADDSYSMSMTDFIPGARGLLFNVAWHNDGRTGLSQNLVRVYDFLDDSVHYGDHYTFEVVPDSNGSVDPLLWLWASDERFTVLAAAGTDGQWYEYHYQNRILVVMKSAPVANIGDETLTYRWLPQSEANPSPRWQLTTVDSELSSEEAMNHMRDYMNVDAAESVRAALEAALVAEFSETGFSLHPGMTAVFDEFQIYDVLGVEREDTLLVPLYWKIVQSPEDEFIRLDIGFPVSFPARG